MKLESKTNGSVLTVQDYFFFLSPLRTVGVLRDDSVLWRPPQTTCTLGLDPPWVDDWR